MDWNRVEGSWKQLSGKVKEQWGKLTDDDIAQINGNREQLEGKIQERYGKAKDDVRREIDDWYGRQRWSVALRPARVADVPHVVQFRAPVAHMHRAVLQYLDDLVDRIFIHHGQRIESRDE